MFVFVSFEKNKIFLFKERKVKYKDTSDECYRWDLGLPKNIKWSSKSTLDLTWSISLKKHTR